MRGEPMTKVLIASTILFIGGFSGFVIFIILNNNFISAISLNIGLLGIIILAFYDVFSHVKNK